MTNTVQITRLPDYPITRLPDYPITRLPDYPITRLPELSEVFAGDSEVHIK